MPPNLQSKRLKEMEQNGLFTRSENRATGDIIYLTTMVVPGTYLEVVVFKP